MLNYLSEGKKNLVIYNISDRQISSVEEDLMLNLPLLRLKDRILKRMCVDFHEKISEIENRLQFGRIKELEEIEEHISSVQKEYLEISHRKYDLKRDGNKYIHFVDRIRSNYKTSIRNLVISLEESFEQIYSFQKRIDSGDSINGVINKLINIRNTRGLTKSGSSSNISDSLLKDESILADHEGIWEIYNNTRETFRKMFPTDDIDDTGLCWEDLINHKFIYEKDYNDNDIETIEELVNFIKNGKEKNENDLQVLLETSSDEEDIGTNLLTLEDIVPEDIDSNYESL